MTTITATSGQSIYDLCLMTYGDFKYLYKLMVDNNIIGLNDTDLSGKKITFNPELVEDVGFFNSLNNKKKVINTLDSTIEHAALDGLQTDDGVDLQTAGGFQIIID